MAAISGETGSVTYALGYVTNAYAWTARPSAGIIDTTTFSPTNSYTMAAAGILDWEGSYRCRMSSVVATTLSAAGAAYDDNPYRFDVELTCEPLDITAFTATDRARIAGLLSARGSWQCWIDDTQPLVVAGTADTLTFTILGATTYSIPLIVESVDVEVAADGSGRNLTCNFVNSADVTSTAGLPLPGTTGAATFVANAGRQLTGNILVTSVQIALDAAREEADYTISWVGAAAATPA